MPLTPIRYYDPARDADVRAWTDGYACDGEGVFYLLSVAGPDSACRAVAAASATGCELEILETPPRSLRWDPWEGYRIRSAKLPCGMLHQMVVARPFFEARDGLRLLHAETDDPAALVLRAVQGACAVPLIPEWKDWLYQKLKQESLLEELRGSIPVLRIRLHEESIAQMVSEGVRTHALAF
ncbi:MAG: hypothetical protein HYU38_04720 [Candidatus Tectomicrobia bacterium]|nr:hypothetical protein [Candidatus Tectomicrobia bacterium]